VLAPSPLPRRRRPRLLAAAVALSVIATPLVLVAPATDAAAASKPKRTVESELRRLRSARTISAADLRAWRGVYREARRTARGLRKRSTARRELDGVIANTEQMARRRAITPSLAPSVFLTLQVNRDWWPSRPVPPVGSRPTVPGSPLVWQYYAGEGLQIQWLGTFGLANALATTKTPAKLEQLRAIEDEALRLASRRAGGPAWQYLFDFGGGRPPWGSGMAQVTGMQSLVRATGKLGDDRYRATALEAAQLIRHSSPTGARWKRSAGDHVLLYTFTRTRVLNAFLQAVSGLHEVAASTGDPTVATLYRRAERQLRVELPQYDTGRWTRYSLGGTNATVSYHTLVRDLTRGLCRALEADALAYAAGQPVAGGAEPPSAAIYCDAAERFTRYLKRTPLGPRATTRAAAGPLAPPPGAPLADPAAHLGPRVAQP